MVNISRAWSTSLCILMIYPSIYQLLLGAADHLLPPWVQPELTLCRALKHFSVWRKKTEVLIRKIQTLFQNIPRTTKHIFNYHFTNSARCMKCQKAIRVTKLTKPRHPVPCWVSHQSRDGKLCSVGVSNGVKGSF